MAATKTILVIDDDPDILTLLAYCPGEQRLPGRDGHGRQRGARLAEREQPDPVVVDMMMPKKSGFLVLEKLKSRREASPRVIMITANEGGRHRAYAEMLGVDDYIRKPFAMERLLESVEKFCPRDEESTK